MHDSLLALNEQFTLNTGLFLNCLDGVDDEAASRRPGPESNSIAFIACHLLDARGYLARFVGAEYESPYQALFDRAQRLEDMEQVPPVEGLRSAWRKVSDVLSERFPALTAEALRRESPQMFPIGDRSVRGGIAFLLTHEAFHIGQLAYVRKYLGLGPMSY